QCRRYCRECISSHFLGDPSISGFDVVENITVLGRLGGQRERRLPRPQPDRHLPAGAVLSHGLRHAVIDSYEKSHCRCNPIHWIPKNRVTTTFHAVKTKTIQLHAMKTKFLLALCPFLLDVQLAGAQGTTFTYQGRLTSGTNAATGSYDLRCYLYDQSSGPNPAVA